MPRDLSIITARIDGKGANRKLIMDVKIGDPRLSSSGKSHLLASESGTSTVQVAGRDVIVNLNAYVPVKKPKKVTLLSDTEATLDAKKKVITFTTPLLDPQASSSGKSMIVAKDSGATAIQLAGGHVNVTFSAYFYPEDKAA